MTLYPAPDFDAQRAWEEEISRRLKELEEGKVKPVPWPEARRTILKRKPAGGENAPD
jgi:hypothetical protein